MIIRGREVKFLRTVKTACELAKMCPGGDLANLDALFTGNVAEINENGAKIIHLMAEGYEMNKHFDDPSYKPNPISAEEVMYLDDETYVALFNEMMEAFTGDKVTVETETAKKNENGTE